jgi:hypothetical protein
MGFASVVISDASLLSEHMKATFRAWLARILPRASMPCVENVLAAYALNFNQMEVLEMAPNDALPMLHAAVKLCAALRECMDNHTLPIQEAVVEFIHTQAVWRISNRSEIYERLLLNYVRRAHDIATRQRVEAQDIVLGRVQRFSLLCGESLTEMLVSAPEVRVIRRLPQSRFWGAGNLSIFRFMHELLMDAEFTVKPCDVLPRFTERYRRAAWTPLLVTEFLVDFRAVVMWPIRDPRALLELARLLDIENMQWPENISDITQRMAPLLCSFLPDEQSAASLRAEWVQMGQTRPATEFLMHVACSLRHAFATVDLAHCRQFVRRHQRGFHPTRANVLVSMATHTRITEAWLRRVLQTSPLLRRVATGDPFALLKLHDHAIIDYVVEGDFSRVPEVLIFDLNRLRAIHATVGNRARDLRRLVDSDEVGRDDPLPLVQAAGVLRTIIFVCRFQHGECIATLARDLAQQVINAMRHLGVD